MKYYSTNHISPSVPLSEAVTRGLAPDGGLYMPERISRLPEVFFSGLADMSFVEASQRVARALFAGVPADKLNAITADTLSFDTPLVEVEPGVYSLELFHGPTLAFKDVGARFMARLLGYFAAGGDRELNVLVATSGDTGSAVANGFLNVPGIHVYVLYPSGKVSRIQESQFTTLGHNITALEIAGTFDDCQRLVKSAFVDADLNAAMRLTSANSINIARLLPQSFYYYRAVSQLRSRGIDIAPVVCVPSGNFGNLTAGLIAARTGLGIKHFIAANNANDVFLEYLETGHYNPRASVQTYANAMDVGAPSNFARILELYGSSHDAIAADISGQRNHPRRLRPHGLHPRSPRGLRLPRAPRRHEEGRRRRIPRDGPPGQVRQHHRDGHRPRRAGPRETESVHGPRETEHTTEQQLRRPQGVPARTELEHNIRFYTLHT